MDWLRAHQFLNNQSKPLMITNQEDCDPEACYDSFKEHWHQAVRIMNRAQQLPNQDDVLGVVNHLEQIVTLLLYDMSKDNDHLLVPNSLSSKCLQYMLSESILETLFDWGLKAGRFTNAIRCEELKLYDVIITKSRHILLLQEPFCKPLLKLLNSCQGKLFSAEIEKSLVDLLSQLCALLIQNNDLIDLFFVKHENNNRFIIFTLLINFVHRESSIGMRARDGLLLCMTLSKKNKNVANYIVERSNFAVLAATGLNGLYSVLPNAIDDIAAPDWRRITPDDVNDIKGLSMFVTSLEFSNAVAQVAHPTIRKQLQEFLYRGFLIPVLGPALLQTNIEEQIAATAYLELILRTLTEPGLLYALLLLLINMEYDGHKLLNMLINRINSNQPLLCLVSLSLFETIVNLNNEDLMLELVFKHLQPCLHLMLSQRRMLLMLDSNSSHSFQKFFNLAPSCCESINSDNTSDVNHASLYGKYSAYLYDARKKIDSCQNACISWENTYSGWEEKNICTKDKPLLSFYSLGESSSDFESFDNNDIITDRISQDDDDAPMWQKPLINKLKKEELTISDNYVQFNNAAGGATVGPFLTLLLEKLKKFLSNSIYINFHITGLISRLAIYSQPLLRTYLLDDSFVLQPNVPSLLQIIGSLKQDIDEYMMKRSDSEVLIKAARDFLVDREARLINARRRNTIKKFSSQNTEEPFQRNERKRRSINFTSITSVFGRRSSSQISENTVAKFSSEDYNLNLVYPKFNEPQHIALCAVLLDEWVKELAALAQEHSISQLAVYFK